MENSSSRPVNGNDSTNLAIEVGRLGGELTIIKWMLSGILIATVAAGVYLFVQTQKLSEKLGNVHLQIFLYRMGQPELKVIPTSTKPPPGLEPRN